MALVQPCLRCENGDHASCLGDQPAAPGVYGGSRCNCACRVKMAGSESPQQVALAPFPNLRELTKGVEFMLGMALAELNTQIDGKQWDLAAATSDLVKVYTEWLRLNAVATDAPR